MRIFFALPVLAILAFPTSARADLRCGNRIVSVGDTVLELQRNCGRPDHVSTTTELRAEGVALPAWRRPRTHPRRVADNRRVGGPNRRLGPNAQVQDVRYIRETVEIWTYAGRAGQLGRVVTVRRGKVARVQTLGKLDVVDNPRCGQNLASAGARIGTVRLSCGTPDDVSRWEEERVIRRRDGLELRNLVTHERWTYDPGRGRLLRILHFENGRLVRIQTGGRSP